MINRNFSFSKNSQVTSKIFLSNIILQKKIHCEAYYFNIIYSFKNSKTFTIEIINNFYKNSLILEGEISTSLFGKPYSNTCFCIKEIKFLKEEKPICLLKKRIKKYMEYKILFLLSDLARLKNVDHILCWVKENELNLFPALLKASQTLLTIKKKNQKDKLCFLISLSNIHRLKN